MVNLHIIVAVSAIQRVGSTLTIHNVVAVTTLDGVITFTSLELIRAEPPVIESAPPRPRMVMLVVSAEALIVSPFSNR